MQYYRCQCGESYCYTSMGVQPCQSCPKCNTTYAQHSDGHKAPVEHDWIIEKRTITHPSQDMITQKAERHCRRCMKLEKLDPVTLEPLPKKSSPNPD